MPASTATLIAAMSSRKQPETRVPTSPAEVWRVEESLSTCPASARTPKESSRQRAKTTEEWPSENQKPTESGRLPSAMSLRVVLSIAAMWSASKACRMPSV